MCNDGWDVCTDCKEEQIMNYRELEKFRRILIIVTSLTLLVATIIGLMTIGYINTISVDMIISVIMICIYYLVKIILWVIRRINK